jgi:hypothetical protein
MKDMENQAVYPYPGSQAERALHFIQANPGCSKNAVTTHLATSPVNSGRYIQKLATRGLIVPEVNARGHHVLWPAAE